ncbi:hypothetical protein GCM10028803_46260 [Larkinella knui]
MVKNDLGFLYNFITHERKLDLCASKDTIVQYRLQFAAEAIHRNLITFIIGHADYSMI